ncbi:MAG: hypothetical protein FD174_613 [Geobacteraceae bacterium]|nr:MAG: hypothetical protein FD174_613 [Geobacteraceae bacterium]
MNKLIEYAFDICEIKSAELLRLVEIVLKQISIHIDENELCFGTLYERRTFSGEAGEVTKDGDILLDNDKLRHYEEDVAMALIAHEFAHYRLNHYSDKRTNTLDMEDEADQLAKDWGFNVDLFRKVCGPATLQGLC